VNIILEIIKPYTGKITGDYQNGFRDVRPVSIIRTIRVNRLRWFGYVQRMEDNKKKKKVLHMNLETARLRGRPRNR
jgi:ribosomal protein S17E